MKAHLGGFPRPSHLSGLHDVGEGSIREDPTAERGAPHSPQAWGWRLCSAIQPLPILTAIPGRWRGQQRSGGFLGVSPGSSSGLQHPGGTAAHEQTCPPQWHEGSRMVRATEVTSYAGGCSPGYTWKSAAWLYSGCAPNLLFYPRQVPSPLWTSFPSLRK